MRLLKNYIVLEVHVRYIFVGIFSFLDSLHYLQNCESVERGVHIMKGTVNSRTRVCSVITEVQK